MASLFFHHNQKVELKISIFDTEKLQADSQIHLFVILDENLTTDKSTLRFDIPKNQYKSISVKFITPSPAKLEIPISSCYRIELYQGNEKIDEIINRDGYLLSIDKFFEYFVKENIMIDILHIPRAEINYFSGAGKPDIIFKDINIEVTHKNEQLSFAKFSEDLAKFDKYKSHYNLKRFILVHDAQSVQPAIKEIVSKRNDVWVLDYVSFTNIFKQIVSHNIDGLRKYNCRGIESSPLKRKKIRVLEEKIDLSDPTRYYKAILAKDSFKPELLYIRDIRPDDLIFLINITHANSDSYRGREGYKNLLIANREYLFQLHEWSDHAKQNVIKREFWFRPLIHMGILDGNYRITSVGEYLYQLWVKNEKDEYNKYIKYRFLQAPGIKYLFKVFDQKQSQILKEKLISVSYFNELILDDLIENNYVSNREGGIRYLNSIKNWMKIFNFGEFISKKGFILNKSEISYILTEFKK